MEKSHFLRYTHTHLRLLYNKDNMSDTGSNFKCYVRSLLHISIASRFILAQAQRTTYPEPNGIEPPKPYEEYSTYLNVVLSLMGGLYGTDIASL